MFTAEMNTNYTELEMHLLDYASFPKQSMLLITLCLEIR